ncbi:MAG: LysM peptidoglycan-binding domain-containing protein [Clostridiales bacterium]|jgi:nucleoid-associated protein YgaU|nr:LysM peptidoglycan-binding domain-containing protein [Clostridiales bacterium]
MKDKNTVKKRIVIRSKSRFSIFLAVLAILCISLIASLLNEGNAANNRSLILVDVVKGDTLWSIAKRTLPNHTDIRQYIIEIKEANNMEQGNIYEGQKLYVPVY